MTTAGSEPPTGNCNFRDLNQGIECGCQKFWVRRKKRRRPVKGKWKLRAEDDGGAGGELVCQTGGGREGENSGGRPSATLDEQDPWDDDDNDDDEQDCFCGHHACFHSFDPAPAIHHPRPWPEQALLHGRRADGRRMKTPSLLSDGRPAPSRRVSGTPTERNTPLSSFIQPSPTVFARNVRAHRLDLSLRPASSNSGLSEVLEHSVRDIEARIPRKSMDTLTSIASSFSEPYAGSPELPVQLSALVEKTDLIGNTLAAHNDRLETVETFGSVLEDIRDRIDLAEDRALEVEEKVLAVENKVDDRLDPVESFIKSRGEKRKLRDLRSPIGEGESMRTRKRRKKQMEGEGGGGEAAAAAGATKSTTITSFTSTFTSNSFSPSPSPSSSTISTFSEATKHRFLTALETIETRVLDLERTAPPSVFRPWVVEIILLPPPPLRGVWFDSASIPGTPFESEPQSNPTVSGGIAKLFGEEARMVPRGFSVNSIAYKRLKSRGFIKTIYIVGGTARHVSSAIQQNFGDLMAWCATLIPSSSSRSTPSTQAVPFSPTPVSPLPTSATEEPQALWQPLRKVHRQTSLEFLTKSEMNEALWSVDFLKGSCAMLGRDRKALYIIATTANLTTISTSTLNSTSSSSSFSSQPVEITWNHIKDLEAPTKPKPDKNLPQDTAPQADIDEKFWEFDERIDFREESPFGSFQQEPAAAAAAPPPPPPPTAPAAVPPSSLPPSSQPQLPSSLRSSTSTSTSRRRRHSKNRTIFPTPPHSYPAPPQPKKKKSQKSKSKSKPRSKPKPKPKPKLDASVEEVEVEDIYLSELMESGRESGRGGRGIKEGSFRDPTVISTTGYSGSSSSSSSDRDDNNDGDVEVDEEEEVVVAMEIDQPEPGKESKQLELLLPPPTAGPGVGNDVAIGVVEWLQSSQSPIPYPALELESGELGTEATMTATMTTTTMEAGTTAGIMTGVEVGAGAEAVISLEPRVKEEEEEEEQ